LIEEIESIKIKDNLNLYDIKKLVEYQEKELSKNINARIVLKIKTQELIIEGSYQKEINLIN
jgi:hypothetical protein